MMSQNNADHTVEREQGEPHGGGERGGREGLGQRRTDPDHDVNRGGVVDGQHSCNGCKVPTGGGRENEGRRNECEAVEGALYFFPSFFPQRVTLRPTGKVGWYEGTAGIVHEETGGEDDTRLRQCRQRGHQGGTRAAKGWHERSERGREGGA